MSPSSRDDSSVREHGALLFEFLVAITVLTVGVLGFVNSFFAQYRSMQSIEEIDAATAALGSVAERISATDLKDVYTTYHNTVFEVEGLRTTDGQPAVVRVTCHVNEAQIPEAFGPVEDIDGDPSTRSTDASTTYTILPVRLSLTYESADGPVTREIHTILYSD